MMQNSLEDWLREQGAQVCGRRPLYRIVLSPMAEYQYTSTEVEELKFKTEHADQMYQIEVKASTLKNWKQYAERLEHVIKVAEQNNYSAPEYFLKNKQRHDRLLVENPMYEQAWREFLQIRALLGEDPQWP